MAGEARIMFQLSDTQIQIKETARRIAIADIGPRAAEVDRTEEYPWDNVGVLKDAGFMGMTLPRELGGQGASYLDAVLVIEEMSRVCGSSSERAIS